MCETGSFGRQIGHGGGSRFPGVVLLNPETHSMPAHTRLWNRINAAEFLIPQIIDDPEHAAVPVSDARQSIIADALADHLSGAPDDVGRVVVYALRLGRAARLSLLGQVVGTNGYASNPVLVRAFFDAGVQLDADTAAAIFVPVVLVDPDEVPLPSPSDARLLALLGLVHLQSHPEDTGRLWRFVRRLPPNVRAEVAERASSLGVKVPSTGASRSPFSV